MVPGQHFGDAELTNQESSELSAIVSEPNTVIFSLRKNDFMSLIEPGLRKLLQKRLKKMNYDKPKFDILIIISTNSIQNNTLSTIFEVENKIDSQKYHLKSYDKKKI